MPLHTPYDIQGLVGAVKTREALEQAGAYKAYGSADRFNSPLTQSSFHSPVYNLKGELFAGNFLQKHFALFLPENIPEDTIIEYQSPSNQYYYGVVIKSNKSRASQITVRDLSADELVEFKKDHPQAQIKTVTDQDLSQLKNASTKLSKLLSLIDPWENFLFKFLFALLSSSRNDDDNVDSFFTLYLRLLFFAVLIILTFYLTTFIL